MLFAKAVGINKVGSVFGAAGIALAAMFFGIRPSSAALIAPGGTVAPDPLAGGMPAGLPAGDSLIASETEPFTGMNAQNVVVFTGSVTSLVFADPSEPNLGAATGQPGEDFVYQLSNGANSTDSIDELALSSFAGFTTGVDYLSNTGTGDLAPATATSSAAPAGKTIGFNFPVPGTIAPGSTTDYVIVQTNATSVPMQGTASVIDGGSGSTGAEAPVATVVFTVPEPATFGVLAVVGGMILGRRRR
jgi:hypothetical protein